MNEAVDLVHPLMFGPGEIGRSLLHPDLKKQTIEYECDVQEKDREI